MLPKTLRAMNLFVDGRGHAGLATELTLPKLTRKTEEHRAAGMDASIEIDMGMEKLEADFTLTDFNDAILKLWGVTDAAGVSLRFKGSIARDDGSGQEDPVEIVLRGRWREIDMGSWKPGDIRAAPVGQPPSVRQKARSSEPAAR